MLFNTVDFIVFLPIVIICYYLLNPKYRWMLLLAASYYFYMCWKLEYIALIIFSTLIDYYCGIQMERRESKKQKRPFLILSIVVNLGLLMGFKYFNFFSDSFEQLFAYFDLSVRLPLIDFLLPVGISFYTFQTLSYSIDVYKGTQKAERHLGYFALYVSFFPQLVAGPIERFSRLTPQLKEARAFSYDNLKNGLRLILFGLFAKMVMADNFAPVVDQVYADPELYGSNGVASALFFYSFQIYGDFFGYSLIAIGSARIMGIKLMDNFKSPYLASGIADFWQRWHISLSTWFRDYLYFPMGGSRVKLLRWILNILVVFIVSGFWHGANFTFIAWGLIFALGYLVEHFVRRLIPRKKELRFFSPKHIFLALLTFVIVTIAWVFFRSESISHAQTMFSTLLSGKTGVLSFANAPLVWTVFSIFILIELALFNQRFDGWIDKQAFIIRWSVYALLSFAVLCYAGVEDKPFIYFQF